MSDMNGDVAGVKRSTQPEVIDEVSDVKKARIEEPKVDDVKKPAEKVFSISSEYSESVTKLEQVYSGSLDAKDVPSLADNKSQMILEPFKVMELKHFLQDESSIKHLTDMAANIELKTKNNDLYSYKVSDEMTMIHEQFKPLLNFLRDDVRIFLQNITKETLNEQLSVTVSRYDKNDYLLCHDDQLEGRKIAFVLYLVDSDWSDSDGGRFEMFDCDPADRQPLNIVRKLVPKRNAFNFFVVAPNTYHQVSEILTDRSPRWSINGWFHSDNAPIVPRDYQFSLITPHHFLKKNANSRAELFESWIASKYLESEFQAEVRKLFEVNSEIQLPEFFKVSKYNQLKTALENPECASQWKEFFRPAFGKYQYVDFEKYPSSIIAEAMQVFYSEEFFMLLSKFTGIGLHPKAMEDLIQTEQSGPSTSSSAITAQDDNKPDLIENPVCRGEVRKWRKGDYSLASDLCPDFKELFGIDVSLFFNQFVRADIFEEINSDKDDDKKDEKPKEVRPEAPGPAEGNQNNNEEDDDDEDDEDFKLSNSLLYASEDDEEEEDDDDEDDDSDCNDSVDSGTGDDDNLEANNGGIVVYIDDESSEELMTLQPAENCLNIVYRTKGTQRFMKYINSDCSLDAIHEISLVYTDGNQYEKPDASIADQ